MKEIGISITDPMDWTGVALRKSILHYGMKPRIFSLGRATSNIHTGKLCAENVDLSTLDAIIVRDLGPASGNDISFRYDILCQIEEAGVVVLNSPESITKAANKYISSYIFQKNGIATPRTVVTNCLDDALGALEFFGEAVVKPVFGYKGIGIERLINDERGAARLRDILNGNRLAYIQEFISNPGRDIRVFIVNNEIIGSIYRIAPPGSWINNLSQGGSAKRCVLTDEQKTMSIKASEVIGTSFAGVDIIEGDRPYIMEINGTPSGKGIFEACGLDVTINIIEHLISLIE